MEINERKAEDTAPDKQVRKSTVTFTKKRLLIAVGIIIFLFGALLLWKSLQIRSLKTEQAERELALRQELSTLHMQQTADYLRRLAKPYVWALRTEMLQGNSGQVNLYNNDMVKERGMLSIMIADTKGVIISSTDKKHEGKNISAFQSSDLLGADSTLVNKVNDSLLLMASPIMSFNSKLGTLIVNYAVSKPVISKN